MWNRNSWDKANEKLKEENTKFKFLLEDCKGVITELTDENAKLRSNLSLLRSEIEQLREEIEYSVKPRSTGPLKPTTALRFKVKRVKTFEDKFGSATQSTKEINILQQWYSISGFEGGSDGEWKDVPTSGSLY